MPKLKANEVRNRKIVAFIESYDWSFQLVADKFGVSRNVVAGIMFRHRHPLEECKKRSGRHSKISSGYRHAEYYPSFTARNSIIKREVA